MRGKRLDGRSVAPYSDSLGVFGHADKQGGYARIERACESQAAVEADQEGEEDDDAAI